MFIIATLAVIALIVVVFQGGRLGALEDRVEQGIGAMPSQKEFEALCRRVTALEMAAGPKPQARQTEKEVSPPPLPPPIVFEKPVVWSQPVLEQAPEVVKPLPSTYVYEPVPEAPVVKNFHSEEWEALVGGSVLNKLGALVLVIGVALFLGYSFAHVGAIGRASVSILLSIALLIGGVWAEKRPRLAVFSRGLIGAGWAALYATAYAIYALPAARIISDARWGGALLLAVAFGMIFHSLRYRKQAITAVAYFAAFAALAVTPTTPFALVSLIPLAASILYLAWRFDWYSMALFGVAATYLTCWSKGFAYSEFAGTQMLVLAYWLLFEAFDLLRVNRRTITGGAEWIFPANALGLCGVSFLVWSRHAPDQVWLAAAYASALYLGSAIARAYMRPLSSFETGEMFSARLRAGSFEGAALISAILAGLAIFGRVPGVWSSFGLAIEAELIYLAGVALGSGFLRGMGAFSFTFSLLRLVDTADPSSRTVAFGHAFWNWTPGALIHAFLFYVNRAIRRGAWSFSTAAAALVAFVLAVEVPQPWAGMSCALFGAILLGVGLWRKLLEFRLQAYVILGFGFAWTACLPIFHAEQPWAALAVCAALAYAIALACSKLDLLPADADERNSVVFGTTAATAFLAALLLWRVTPVDYLGMAWCGLAVVLLELGLHHWPSEFRWSISPTAILFSLGIFATHFNDLQHLAPLATWTTYLAAFLASVWAALRLSGDADKQQTDRDLLLILGTVSCSVLVWLVTPVALISLAWTLVALALMELGRRFQIRTLAILAVCEIALAYGRVMLIDLSGGELRLLTIPVIVAALYWLGSRYQKLDSPILARFARWSALAAALALTVVQAGPAHIAGYWAIISLALLIYGTFRNSDDFRLQSYVTAALTLVAVIAFDLSPGLLYVSLPVAACFYLSRFVAREEQQPGAPALFGISGSLLLAAVLFSHVSGGMLTVAWGLEGLFLLATGFGLRDRPFRLQGLGLLLLCTVKLFLYDLRTLETPYRILSFVALGLILLSVSWIYNRFREQVRRIL